MKKFIVVALLLNAFLLAGRFLQEMGAFAQEAPTPSGNGDVNADGSRDITDAIYLLSWLFQGGPEPIALAGAPELEDRVAALEGFVAGVPAEVGSWLVENHLETLRGPEGPQGPAGKGGGDPLSEALEELTRFVADVGPAPAHEADELIKAVVVRGGRLEVSLLVAGESPGTVVGMTGEESLSTPYRFNVIFSRGEGKFDTLSCVGQIASLRLEKEGSTRIFRGRVTHCGQVSQTDSTTTYSLSMSPELEELSRRRSTRIFSDSKSADVANLVLADAGLTASFELSDEQFTRSYYVQYNETDLDFISRTFETDGLFYYFTSEEGEEMVKVADSNTSFTALADEFRYYGHESRPSRPGERYIRTLHSRHRKVTGRVVVEDYDYVDPFRDISAAVGAKPGATTDYVYGIGATLPGEALRAATHRLQSLQVDQFSLGGTSNTAGLRPGKTFRLSSAGGGFDGEYYVTQVEHTLLIEGEDTYYSNRFKCTPRSVPYRPGRITPRPVARGLQTAEVVGFGGNDEGVQTDPLGRVKVRFPWNNDDSSAWLRVGMPKAGKGGNLFFLPEIGDEVLVAFEQGDIRRPVVIGSVYNGNNRPPVPLPDDKTVRIIVTISSTETRNEIRLDGKAGEELLDMSAAKNMNIAVANDYELRAQADLSIRSGDSMDLTATRVELSAVDLGIAATSSLAIDSPRTLVSGVLQSSRLSTTNDPVEPGYIFSDNSIVAWARVDEDGSLMDAPFGVTSSQLGRSGEYKIVIAATSASQLVPVVTPLVLSQPGPGDVNIASVNQTRQNTFEVYLNSITGASARGAFVIIVTAR